VFRWFNGEFWNDLSTGSSSDLGNLEVNQNTIRNAATSNNILTLSDVGPANYFIISNSDSAGNPKINVAGSDININLMLEAKGTAISTLCFLITAVL
jgi:hypothetical protein